MAGKQAVSNKEIISSKIKGFRGFKKLPMVVLERINNIPLPNNKSLPHKWNGVPIILNGSKQAIPVHMQKLVKDCSVSLARINLKKLNSKRNNINSTRQKKASIFHCNNCTKIYKHLKCLQNHIANKHNIKPVTQQQRKRVSFSNHVIVHEVQASHRCKKCPKIFKKYKSLKVHLKRKHMKPKCYICNYCTKEFRNRMLFKNHIKLHCDTCRVLLLNRSEYTEHKVNKSCNRKRFNCKICNENYFRFSDLMEHSFAHISTCFICDFCKEQFDTKCQMMYHISVVHMEKCPEELYVTYNKESYRLYICNFCEETSVEKTLIESHVSILQVNKLKNYCCNQCSKKFVTETEMVQHKKTHLKTKDTSPINQDENTQKTSKTSKECDTKKIVTKTKMVQHKKTHLKTNDTSHINQDENTQKTFNTSKECDKNKDLPVSDKDTCKTKDAETQCHSNSSFKPIKIKDIVNDIILQHSTSINQSTMSNPLIDCSSQTVLNNQNICNEETNFSNSPRKTIVHPQSKTSVVSGCNCEICGINFPSYSSLSRHNMMHHCINYNLCCKNCEATLPPLLPSNNCICMNMPEMSLMDATDDVKFSDKRTIPDSFNELNTQDDVSVGADYEIPPTPVELIEFDQYVINGSTEQKNITNDVRLRLIPYQNYNFEVKEVPIEF